MANTLADYTTYFAQLTAAHVELGSFVHGAAARIIAGSRDELTYPLLWLETPTLVLHDKDGTAPFGTRHGAFVVLVSAPAKDYEAQNTAWQQAERIALDVLSYLRRDKKARKHTFELDEKPLEPVATLTVAGEIGWRYEFALGDFVPLAFDATRWKGGPTV